MKDKGTTSAETVLSGTPAAPKLSQGLVGREAFPAPTVYANGHHPRVMVVLKKVPYISGGQL
jgi:hypothetical protein